MSVGTGLMTTFRSNTRSPMRIEYQVLFGFGGGVAFQQPMVAAQVVF